MTKDKWKLRREWLEKGIVDERKGVDLQGNGFFLLTTSICTSGGAINSNLPEKDSLDQAWENLFVFLAEQYAARHLKPLSRYEPSTKTLAQ